MINPNFTKAINWNNIEDLIDKSTWEKLTEQFWLDTRIPLSNDLDDWRSLSDLERNLVSHVFGGLTLLDTVQSDDFQDIFECRISLAPGFPPGHPLRWKHSVW